MTQAKATSLPRTNDNRGARLAFWCLWLLSLVCLVACSQVGNGRETIQANQASLRGQQVYQQYCAACHDATDLHLVKDPPRLDGLLRKQAFPRGAPATDDELRSVILHGRGIMPPFEGTLGDDDVNALVQYMHTR
jgi:mono/diheme cytochrome c family protein